MKNFILNTEYSILNTEKIFPFIGLIVSGGHTDLLLFKSVSKFKWLGGTRDDAAGEALDKIGRLLGLPYPAGPIIEQRAKLYFNSLSPRGRGRGEEERSNIKFQSPLVNSDDFDFSFSGLKTEISRFINKKHLTERLINEICYALQESIFAVLIKKTIRAAKLYKINQIALGGGVSANQTLRQQFELEIGNLKLEIALSVPPKEFSTDNAAMIGAAAYFQYTFTRNKKRFMSDWKTVKADPALEIAR